MRIKLPELALRLNSPFSLLTVPVLVPFTRMEAPEMGEPSCSSRMTPEIVLTWASTPIVPKSIRNTRASCKSLRMQFPFGVLYIAYYRIKQGGLEIMCQIPLIHYQIV